MKAYINHILIKVKYFARNAVKIFYFPIYFYKTWSKVDEIKVQLNEVRAEQLKVRRNCFFNGEKYVFLRNKKQGNELISELLSTSKPIMISRHGRTELMSAYSFEFSDRIESLDELQMSSGFFPKDQGMAKEWADLYLTCSKDMDCLCAWNYRFGCFTEEETIYAKYSPNAQIINQMSVLTPFFEKSPWTRILKNKRILIIHPFEKSIQMQYGKRHLLFPCNPEILPDFAELHTIRAVQTIVGNTDSRFNTWFEAYKWMCDESDLIDFDIALIAAGAYGLPLASHIKRSGRKAVHIGGGLQLLFGIYGIRWRSDLTFRLEDLVNEHWVSPLPEERPANAEKMENGAYW
jgi:hypothetical protein